MLKLSRATAEVFIPDGSSWETAAARVTHLVVAAHADDVELMAWHAILNAGGLCAVIVTGGGELRDTRLQEQKRAAARAGLAAGGGQGGARRQQRGGAARAVDRRLRLPDRRQALRPGRGGPQARECDVPELTHRRPRHVGGIRDGPHAAREGSDAGYR